jgi:hypothetical protein
MKKKILIIGGLLLVATLVLVFSLKTSATEGEYFKEITLSENNSIINKELPTYYDTVISVGLDAAGLTGVYIVVGQLTDAAKDQFNGELKAHIRFYNGVYYLFTNEMDRTEAIRVISHELIHVNQYNTGQLVYDNGEITWNGEKYDLSTLDYDYRPWEKNAFDKEGDLSNKISEILY